VGDGTSTFGFPLEADLINPFGDPSYNPFIKYGTRTSSPGMVFVNGTLEARFINGTSLGAVVSITGGGFAPARGLTSMSADASILVAARAVSTVQNIFAWKRNGLTYEPLTLSNPLPTAENGVAASVTKDGRYLAFVAAGAANRDRVFIYKLNLAGTSFDLLTTVTYTALDADAYTVDWSPQGNYLGIGANVRGGAANGGRILSRSGDTFTVSNFSSTVDRFAINT
jgi:WD40 repeat protein